MEWFHEDFLDPEETGAIAAIGRTDFGVFHEVAELFPQHLSVSLIGQLRSPRRAAFPGNTQGFRREKAHGQGTSTSSVPRHRIKSQLGETSKPKALIKLSKKGLMNR
jgi:hypothetical protein